MPPGVDFTEALADGLLQRHAGSPIEDLPKIEIYVNTRRTQRRLSLTFNSGPALLLPRIRLISDLARNMNIEGIPPPVSHLQRRLELMQLVAGLLDAKPDLAPRAALFDLADSLARLMDEMQGERVLPENLHGLDVSDVSGHWQKGLEFIALVERYFGKESGEHPDHDHGSGLSSSISPPNGRKTRRIIQSLWLAQPDLTEQHRCSCGLSRSFPQGAVILSAFDFDMPAEIWQRLDNALNAEDHPQFPVCETPADARWSTLATCRIGCGARACRACAKPFDLAGAAPRPR